MNLKRAAVNCDNVKVETKRLAFLWLCVYMWALYVNLERWGFHSFVGIFLQRVKKKKKRYSQWYGKKYERSLTTEYIGHCNNNLIRMMKTNVVEKCPTLSPIALSTSRYLSPGAETNHWNNDTIAFKCRLNCEISAMNKFTSFISMQAVNS